VLPRAFFCLLQALNKQLNSLVFDRRSLAGQGWKRMKVGCEIVFDDRKNQWPRNELFS
jgi:hypothetical protein